MDTEDSKARFVEHLCEFVRIPSRSSARGGEEGRLQALLADRMRAQGAHVRAFTPDDIPAFFTHPLCHGPDRQYEDRPTVIGEIGPKEAPALLVLAHSDTVPLYLPEAWTRDPFGGEVRDGKVWGLGASDDKWGLAALLVLLRALTAAWTPLRKRLIFASTVDEESGVGNGALLLTLAGVQAESALYLDGADQHICIGNLGGSNLYLRPRAALSPSALADHAARLQTVSEALSRQRAPLYEGSLFRDNMTRDRSVVFRRDSDAQGSHFILHFYLLPGEERATFCEALEAAVSQALGEAFSHYTLAYREPWFEPALIDPATPLVRHLAAAYRDVAGEEPCITTISKQDAFVLTNHARIPTVSFGPAHAQGPGAFHQPDECVEIEEAWQCCRIAYAAVCRWLES